MEDSINLRKEYKKDQLSESQMNSNPIIQFEDWFKKASESAINEPYAMTLATCDLAGRPSARIVLLRHYSEQGFVFFTNYASRKGMDLEDNPQGALLFYWDLLEQQIRIEGLVKEVTSKLSDEYFNSRPKESRIGALASNQSRYLESRDELDNKYAELTEKYKNTEKIPRPKDWGGYILQPNYFEFWQGGAHRLHDRMAYIKSKGVWSMKRLAP